MNGLMYLTKTPGSSLAEEGSWFRHSTNVCVFRHIMCVPTQHKPSCCGDVDDDDDTDTKQVIL